MSENIRSRKEIFTSIITMIMFMVCLYSAYYVIVSITASHRNFVTLIINITHQQESYDKNYIKNNPEMKPVINRYNNCKDGLVNAIEGCMEYASIDKQEQLNEYLMNRENIASIHFKQYVNSEDAYIEKLVKKSKEEQLMINWRCDRYVWKQSNFQGTSIIENQETHCKNPIQSIK